MLLSALLITLAAEPLPNINGPIFSQPSVLARPFFEAFPISGTGTTGECGTTAPTGTQGEVFTAFTRATGTTCTKGSYGFRTTGIADGDVVELGAGVIRQERDVDAILGISIHRAATNVLTRFIEICDTNWSNVGTPSLTGQAVSGAACATTTAQASPFSGTYANKAVLIDDNDGAAFEGRQQTVTVTAAAAYIMHCYVKAGTLASARITLDGTANTITGLSSSTWSIIEVTDASTSGVSVVAQVMAGDTAGGTGTVIFGGCQVESGSDRSTIIPTTTAAVTRNADQNPSLAGVSLASLATEGCSSIYISPLMPSARMGAGAVIWFDTSGRPQYYNGLAGYRIWDGVSEPSAVPAFTVGTSSRFWSSWSATANQKTIAQVGGAPSSTTFASLNTTGPLVIGNSTGIGSGAAWILSRVRLERNPARCR